MRSLFRSFYTSLVAGFSGRRWLPIIFVCFICVMVPSVTHANWLFNNTAVPALQLIVALIAWVVEMLASLFVYLVDIFLGFAQYNGFGDALPVKLGWVIVRDICNMFFIVVLLISAFSTIIGWDSSLRYNSVLPKLLLMAVLINFSRTLIQVLIDFSQVVMLTFVNAFRNAGAGNFVNAFRINDLTSMADNLGNSQQQAFTNAENGDYNLAAQVFASFLLALVLVIIANGVMLIMVAYILARIIGLWMVLIFSPAAFFVTALPGKLQSGVSSFAGKYWSRLGGMLTGGPVVMFFIYLTFAILQAPAPASNTPPPPAASTTPAASSSPVLGGGGNNLSNQLGLRTATPSSATNASIFLTRVGTSDNVASFIVAVALMLMALEAAVEAANAVDSSVGKFASSVGSASKGLAFGAAALAASAPWLATKMGYRTVDKRLDITGKASQLGLGLTNKIPLLGQFARKPLMAGMMMRTNEAAKEAQDLKAAAKGMTADQKRTVQGGFRSTIGSTIGNLSDNLLGEGVRRKIGGNWFSRGDQQAAGLLAQDLASEATLGEDKRNIEKSLEASFEGDARFEHLGPRGQSQLASYMAADANLQNRRQQLEEMETQGKRLNDHSMLDYVNGERRKDPRLISSEARLNESVRSAVVNDPSKSKGFAEDVVADTGFLTRALQQAQLVSQPNANGVVQAINDPARLEAIIRDIKPHNAALARNMERWYNDLSHNTARSGERGMEVARASRGRIETDENGNTKTYINPEVGRDLSAHIATLLSPLTGRPMFGQADPRGTMFGVRDVDRIAAEVQGGLTLRNTDQANALNQLTALSQSPTLTPVEQVNDANATRAYFDAGGDLADLERLGAGPLRRSMQNFGNDLAQQLQAANALTYDPSNEQLTVNSAQQDLYRQITRLMRAPAQQVGGRGIGNEIARAVLDGLSGATIAVPGVPATTPPIRLTDVAASRGTFGSMNQPTRKAFVQLYGTAQAIEHTPTLAMARRKHDSPDRDVRVSLPQPIDRVFDVGPETG